MSDGTSSRSGDIKSSNEDNELAQINNDIESQRTNRRLSEGSALQHTSSNAPPPPDSAPPAVTKKADSPSSPFSVRSSGTASPTLSDTSDELPTNISSPEQLALLPPECLSEDNEARPLRHVDENDVVSNHALHPMLYSVIFILTVELLERFCFYGINYTQTSYLTGVYNPDWNADMDAVPASSYVSISVAVAYTAPFVGAFFSDSWFGEYWTILIGSLGFYLPGLCLIALTTVPGMLGPEFNRTALAIGLLVLWPLGTGIVKSVVNVFGAKQFHPILQSSLIESYYVKFYMCINIGALVGGIMVPLLAQSNVTLAYFLPVVMLSLAITSFVCGSRRYVITKPKVTLRTLLDMCNSKKRKRAIELQNMPPSPSPSSSSDQTGLLTIFRISLLVVPFNIAYSQMATTFIVQGTVMKKAFGVVDAACMNNADAISVLLFGYLVGEKLYPALADRGIKIPTTYKFAFGSALGAAAILWALMVERMITSTYEANGGRISILWQGVCYILIGAGEIFAVSAAYEVAFTAAPPEKKVLASALNLFCVGGLPNVLCIALYNVCQGWFRNKRGTTSITKVRDYASAHVDYYFWLLFAIACVGALVNLVPQVRKFVETIEERASDVTKSPRTPSRPPVRDQRRRETIDDAPLIRIKRHQEYLKYGTGPTLNKLGSFRAGPFMRRSRVVAPPRKSIKRNTISKLYRSSDVSAAMRAVMTAQGKPIMAGEFMKNKEKNKSSLMQEPIKEDNETEPLLQRSNSGSA